MREKMLLTLPQPQ